MAHFENQPIDPVVEYLIPDVEEQVNLRQTHIFAKQIASINVAGYRDPSYPRPDSVDALELRARRHQDVEDFGDFLHLNAFLSVDPETTSYRPGKIIEAVWKNGVIRHVEHKIPGRSFYEVRGFNRRYNDDGMPLSDKEANLVTEGFQLPHLSYDQEVETAIIGLSKRSQWLHYSRKREVPADPRTTVTFTHSALMQKDSRGKFEIAQDLAVEVERIAFNGVFLAAERKRDLLTFRRNDQDKKDQGWRFIAQYDSVPSPDNSRRNNELRVPSPDVLDLVLRTIVESE